jgi:DNA repair exonuclease SbcCD ATPase subunit
LSEKLEAESFTYPFTGEIKAKIDKILTFDQFQSTQKLQLILNEISKYIAAINEEKSTLVTTDQESREQTKNVCAMLEKSQHLLNSVLRELKNLEITETKLNTFAFCEADQSFLDFMADQCLKLDNLPEAAQFLGPLFVPAEMFSDENFQKRKEIIDRIAQTDKGLSCIMSALFLINTRLKKQVTVLTEGQGRKAALLQSLGADDFEKVCGVIEELQGRIRHLTETRKEIHAALVAARDSLQGRDKAESELARQLQAAKQRLEEATKENAQLKSLKKLSHKPAEENSITVPPSPKAPQSQAQSQGQTPPQLQSHSHSQLLIPQSPPPPTQISIPADSNEWRHTIKALQRSLQEKKLEVEALRKTVERQKQELCGHSQEFMKREQELAGHIGQLQEDADCARQRCERSRRKAKRFIGELREKHAAELQRVERDGEGIAARSVAEAKQKMEAANALLQEAAAQGEKKNRELAEENGKLHRVIHELEVRVNGIQEQFGKDQKSIQSLAAMKLLTADTQHQREMKELRMKLEKEKTSAIEFFTRNLGGLFGFMELDFDEGALQMLFKRLQDDLTKLRYFQEQAIKN